MDGTPLTLQTSFDLLRGSAWLDQVIDFVGRKGWRLGRLLPEQVGFTYSDLSTGRLNNARLAGIHECLGVHEKVSSRRPNRPKDSAAGRQKGHGQYRGRDMPVPVEIWAIEVMDARLLLLQ